MDVFSFKQFKSETQRKNLLRVWECVLLNRARPVQNWVFLKAKKFPYL